MSNSSKHPMKLVLLVCLPIILFAFARTLYVSSPQYALKSFLSAIRSDNVEQIQYYSTKDFPSGSLQLMDTEIQLWGATPWERTRIDRTHYKVQVSDGRGNSYQFSLLKTAQGWKVDIIDGSYGSTYFFDGIRRTKS